MLLYLLSDVIKHFRLISFHANFKNPIVLFCFTLRDQISPTPNFSVLLGLTWSIKPGFTFDNYFIDKLMYFYYSNRHVFEYNTWFSFCHVFRVSVTKEISLFVKNEFHANFTTSSPEKISCVRVCWLINLRFKLFYSLLSYLGYNLGYKKAATSWIFFDNSYHRLMKSCIQWPQLKEPNSMEVLKEVLKDALRLKRQFKVLTMFSGEYF